MSVYSDTIRRLFAESEKIRDKELSIPDDIVAFYDISYGNRGSHPEWQLLDVYLPLHPSGEFKRRYHTVVNVHGGGWVQGDKEGYKYYCISLVKHGFAVVNFSYRLAPEYTFPAPLEDISQVLNWILENSEQYGFDTENIFGISDSAGSNILSLYAALDTSASKEYSFIPAKLHFKAIALNCPAFRIPPLNEMERMTRYQLSDYIGAELTDDSISKLNARSFMTSDFPPAYIMFSYKDTAREDPRHIIEAMEENGITYEYRLWGTKENPLKHVFHLDVKTPMSYECSKEAFDFFRKIGGINE